MVAHATNLKEPLSESEASLIYMVEFQDSQSYIVRHYLIKFFFYKSRWWAGYAGIQL